MLPNFGAPNLIKSILLYAHQHQHSNNRWFQYWDPSNRQVTWTKMSRKTSRLNDIVYQWTYRYLKNITSQHWRIYILLGSTQKLVKVGHILGYKTNLKKNTEITLCILSDQNAIKHQIYSKQIYSDYANSWILNTSLLND